MLHLFRSRSLLHKPNKKMKKIILTILALITLGFGLYQFIGNYQSAEGVKEDILKSVESSQRNTIQDGDIIFQTSKSSQSKAIQLATHSEYSHMGIIYERKGELYVYEAVQPVKFTRLNDWIERGQDKHYVIKRLKNSDKVLTQKTLTEMKRVGEKFVGKDYDLTFEWSNDKIYCSELVWKIYKDGANIEIGALEKLSSFDLKDEIVQQKMKERYGDNFPMNEKVISPAEMFDSDKLEIVIEN
jgi:uncharacterized protein YycO